VKVVAPGKVLLFGAYSVLEGTQALVVAVDRYAVADTSRLGRSDSREVRAAIGDEPAPAVSVDALHEGGQKLGLGSSAAALVATLAARAAMGGKDLGDPLVRKALFLEARRAHAAAQGGGSGVDVAASTFGGALFYAMTSDPPSTRSAVWSTAEDDPFVVPTELPRGLALRVLWSGQSARTSELLSRVARLEEREKVAYDSAIDEIGLAVNLARGACEKNDLALFVRAGRQTGRALAELGRLSDAPIVPPAFKELAALAEREGAAFYPSGAGGGDVGVWLAPAAPSDAFVTRANGLGMSVLNVGLDHAGVRRAED
jgi:phosphomevalonate kinase